MAVWGMAGRGVAGAAFARQRRLEWRWLGSTRSVVCNLQQHRRRTAITRENMEDKMGRTTPPEL